MLLNISNHPTDKWSAEQRKAAAIQFGDVIDVPFPNVDPTADSHTVGHQAVKFVSDALDTHVKPDGFCAALVQGEMVFVYAAVNTLKRKGIPCYAATTERKVVENADGSKTTTFEFVRFRAYP